MAEQGKPIKGRGAGDNPANRFHDYRREAFDDGWGTLDDTPETVKTELIADNSRSVIVYNQSPDVPFDRSINPYRGCEHGCAYCFARPTHAYLDCSPGLDFETRILAKTNAPELLRRELSAPGYHCEPIAIGVNTDAYQPAERRFRITRRLLAVLAPHRTLDLSITTKSDLVLRDLDLIAELARTRRLTVNLSLSTVDPRLAGR